ncbi:MAG: hypothetical protein BGN82_06225 [Alphaproteobacteria bacterium 65-7]|nr:MAG: hypothetical protein BGN82_06225 [Alphaproteobacteria bacterium 65-7]
MDAACIPLVQGNQDCRRFLKEWRDGAEVRDADGEPLPYSEQAVRDLGLEPRDLADTLAGQPAEVAA